jgi:hypothetical protein
MATPRQILAEWNQVPDTPTIAHEVGHTAVAYHQVRRIEKRKECCIVFRHRGQGDGAHSINPITDSTPRELIMRHLAGISCQAIHCPDTVEAAFREKLARISLFESDQSIKNDSTEANAMTRHGASSDWENTMNESKRVSIDNEGRLAELRTAHQELAILMQTDCFSRICQHMIADVSRWLDEEPKEPNFFAIYLQERIAGVFAQNSDPPCVI